jgi:hypothetical protein
MSSHDIAALLENTTRFEVVRLEDLKDPLVRQGIAYWDALRGPRAFPSRGEVNPRAVAPLLSRAILLKVIGGGEDFEFAIVGDDVNRAYCAPLLHRRLSEIACDLPNSAAWWGRVYRDICRTGRPWAVCMHAGSDGETNYSDGEAALLPLGASQDSVDHIVTFAWRRLMRT